MKRVQEYEIIKKAVEKALKECGEPNSSGTSVFGGKFDRFKYELAVGLVEYFSLFDWIKNIWYADIKGGEFLRGYDAYGRDLDILIEGDVPQDFNKEEFERELEDLITKAMEDSGRNLKLELEIPNIIELHINDEYVRIAKNGSGNAIKIYLRDG